MRFAGVDVLSPTYEGEKDALAPFVRQQAGVFVMVVVFLGVGGASRARGYDDFVVGARARGEATALGPIVRV